MYVYPVLSRRSGGLSIGINLNPNNACNWRCIYCQVPDLQRGSAPEIDIALLSDELSSLLDSIDDGSFSRKFRMPAEDIQVRDIAFSGNGEPTSARQFTEIVRTVGQTTTVRLASAVPHVLITNGSLMHQAEVQSGVQELAKHNGQVWFKLDRASTEGLKSVNNAAISLDRMKQNLQICSRLCPTWIQSCFFQLDGRAPSETELMTYLDFLQTIQESGMRIQGVQLYGIERPSMQAEAARLDKVSADWLAEVGEKIEKIGYTVIIKI